MTSKTLKQEKKQTKLSLILSEQGLSQIDLFYLIQSQTGKTIGLDRISKMANGKINYTIETAKIIAKTLDVTLDRLVD